MTKDSHRTHTQDKPPAGKKRLGVNERLALIGLIDEGMRLGSSESPVVADLFSDLWDLVNTTVAGSKIDRLKPKDSRNGFHEFEINSETGENLGRLKMLYLRKPIPCYYLVYVEVALPFRNKALGNRILRHFKDFLTDKSSVGILDNIIPAEDPTFNIYLKQSWKPIGDVIGNAPMDVSGNYMIYIPPQLKGKDLKESVLRLMHHIKRKRAAIDMRENAMMVQQTITEFKDLYSALLTYFEADITRGTHTSLMRFMFTRFVTKLIAFRRRIGELLGYTGGESLEQIVLNPEVAALPLQSYAPRELSTKPSFVTGDKGLWFRFSEEIKTHPARAIEALPNYQRPSLTGWLEKEGRSLNHILRVGDLMALGFDPTRLKEIAIDDEPFIFERIQVKQLPELEKKKGLLEQRGPAISGTKARNASLKVNPPLLTIRDRGNAYVLRRKIDGIHWEEAVEQLQTSPQLKPMNEHLKLDRLIRATVREARGMISSHEGKQGEELGDLLTFFVSWDLSNNRPGLMIDFASTSFESVWAA